MINSNWTQEIMARQKKKLRYSEETPWFPEYYIGWIGIGNCGQKTSNAHDADWGPFYNDCIKQIENARLAFW